MSTLFTESKGEQSFMPGSSTFLGQPEHIETGPKVLSNDLGYATIVISLEILKELAERLASNHFYPMSNTFDNYLTTLNQDARFSQTRVVSDVRRLFLMLSRQLSLPALPDPQALADEEGSLSLAWEIGKYQFTVDVFPNRQIDWFWRDSSSGEFTGEEAQSLDNLPSQLVDCFRKAIKSE